MAKSHSGSTRPRRRIVQRAPNWGRLLRIWLLRGALGFVVILGILIAAFAVINPPTNLYMSSESRRLGGVEQIWVPMDQINPIVARAVVAAEDANFCLHWGLDIDAIRTAMEDGGARGASTISQQVVKNVYLWQGRSWLRKVLEAALTPLVEAVWSKERILEVYLNVAEFDEGIFGIEAAARHYYGVSAAELSSRQAARLAVVLPDPKGRSPRNPTDRQARRADQILDGAATIARDGRAACFQ